MNPTLEKILLLALALAGVFVSAIASGTEIAMYSLNRVRLSLRTDRAAEMIRHELEKPGRLLATLLIWLNIATYVSTLATTRLLEGLGSPAAIAVVNTCLLAPILFIFAEALPKDLFRIEADALAYRLATPLAVGRLLLTWIGLLPLVQGLTRLVERAGRLQSEGRSDARQRIAMLLKEGAGSGVLSEAQLSLVDRALLLRGVHVRDEMVPWASVRSIPLDADHFRARRLLVSNTHARVPVVGLIERQRPGHSYQGVVGVLHQIDLYLNPRARIAELVKPVARLKPGVGVQEALLQLREQRAPMGIVEDAAGRPIGLVTPADLLEPLTGEMARI